MRRNSVPTYRLHKQSGQAIVTLQDPVTGIRRDFLLGKHGTPESKAEYRRVLAEIDAAAGRLPSKRGDVGSGEELTMNELLIAFWRWAQRRYVKNGKATSEQDCIKMAIRFLRDLYGTTLARDFGPLALKAIREAMVRHKITRTVNERDPKTGKVRKVEKVVRDGLARSQVNKAVSRIKAVFKWGVAEEMIPGEVYQRLACVGGLKRGEGGVRETAPVRPVADAVIAKTLEQAPPVVADMVQVQRLSGARPGEIVQLRGCDLNMSGAIWEYMPVVHKTEHHERERIIFFGPQAQAILNKYLSLELTAPLFNPQHSEAERAARMRTNRATPLYPSHVQAKAKERAKRGRRFLNPQYSVATYRRAIARACAKAGVPTWFPHQLRHTAATDVRRQFGIEASQAVLGHAELCVTQVYAEKDLEAARMVMAKIG